MGKANSDEQAWFEDQVTRYEERQPRYALFGEFLKEVLKKAAEPVCSEAIVGARAKSVESFARKILRYRDSARGKGHPLPDFAEELHDSCGARVIVHLQTEIRQLQAFVGKHFEVLELSGAEPGSRMGVAEFGYESTHMIVRIRDKAFPTDDIPVTPDSSLLGLKAEIQLRTVAQHAWADTMHDRLYKSALKIPDAVGRKSARIAALLENADQAFGEVAQELDTLGRNVSVYTEEEEARQEILRLETLRPIARDPAKIVSRMARLHLSLGEFDSAIAKLEEHMTTRGPDLDSEMSCLLGTSFCQAHRRERHSLHYSQGREHLERAVKQDPQNIEALTTLGEEWAEVDAEEALKSFKQAFEVDPTEPRALAGFLRHEIAAKGDLAILDMVRPNILAAIEKCRVQAEVGVNLPGAHYNTAELELLVGEPYRAMTALTLAISYSTDATMIERALAAARLLNDKRVKISGLDWACSLLLVANQAKFPDSRNLEQVRSLATEPPLQEPLIIVAGGCDKVYESQVRGYMDKLRTAFTGFRGTVISGGTREGISGMVGELAQEMGGALQAIGYVPSTLNTDGTFHVDEERFEIRQSAGTEKFSACEPLQNWIDILASGIDPKHVKLLGINGGRIARFEYQLAAVLGARVGVIRHSGREADRFEDQEEWARIAGLLLLPDDAQTLRVFVQGPGKPFPNSSQVDELARGFHEGYVQQVARTSLESDEGRKKWSDLDEHFKDSNRQQVHHILFKLSELGLTAVRVEGRPAQIREFDVKELDQLAVLEHARYNVERIVKGWKQGARDPGKRESPYLKPWKDIERDVRVFDYRSIELIPELLANAGWEIRPLGLSDLREDPQKYFAMPADTELLPVKMLVPTRARIDGICDANGEMQRAYEGTGGRREPIEVRRGPGDTYIIQDGNSTFANALYSEWKTIPCLVVGGEDSH